MIGESRRDGPTPADLPTNPGLVPVRFRHRRNRFVIEAETPDGRIVAAHLPNTGRLTHLTASGSTWLLRTESDPSRKTAFTAVRAWDGCWVALEASRASKLLSDWLDAGGNLPGIGPVTELRSEVPIASHRLDLAGKDTDGRPVWIEVKSGGRVFGGDALLSETPSTRGAAHLEALSGIAATDSRAVAAFVIQRPDADRLLVGPPADAGWIEAVRGAAARGVHVLAFRCTVAPDRIEIERSIPVVLE